MGDSLPCLQGIEGFNKLPQLWTVSSWIGSRAVKFACLELERELKEKSFVHNLLSDLLFQRGLYIGGSHPQRAICIYLFTLGVKKVLFVKVTCLYISTGQWDGLVLALVPPLPNLLGHAAVGQNSTPRKLGKDDISLQICCFGKNVLDVHWFLPSWRDPYFAYNWMTGKSTGLTPTFHEKRILRIDFHGTRSMGFHGIMITMGIYPMAIYGIPMAIIIQTLSILRSFKIYSFHGIPRLKKSPSVAQRPSPGPSSKGLGSCDLVRPQGWAVVVLFAVPAS